MNNPEKLEQVRTNEIKHLKETNQIQAMLLMRVFGENGNEFAMQEWAIDHSAFIRAIFDDMVEDNEALLEEWKDPAKREAILNTIQEELKHRGQWEMAA